MPRGVQAQRYPIPSDDDLARAREFLTRVGGPNVIWSADDVLEVLIGEHRLNVERVAAKRLLRATWVLVGATIVLAISTVALIFATLAA